MNNEQLQQKLMVHAFVIQLLKDSSLKKGGPCKSIFGWFMFENVDVMSKGKS